MNMHGASGVTARLLAAYDGITSSRARRLAVAACISILTVVAATLAWIPNGVYDDWSISNALSTHWGESQGLCLFINTALSNVVFALNTAIPNINWFFVLERFTAFVALFAITYLSLTHLSAPFAGITIFGALAFELPGCTYESNFTYVAGIMVCAGGLALLCSLSQDRHSPALVVVGVILICVGALWRWTMFVLCVPIMGVTALIMIFGLPDTRSVLGKIAKLGPFVLAIAVFAVAYFYDAHVWSEEPWHEWVQFNEMRSEISDYSYESYDDVADKLDAIGVTENDYRMLKSWLSEDPDFYTTERLIAIRDIVNAKRSNPMRILGTAPEYLSTMVTSVRFDVLFALLLIAVVCCSRGRARGFSLFIIAGTLVLCWALFAFGRLPARVSIPTWMYAVVSIGALCRKADLKALVLQGAHRKPEAGVAPVVKAAFGMLPAVAVIVVLAVSLTHVRTDRLEPLLSEDSFAPDNYLLNYIAEHDENVFALNVASQSTLIYANLMIAPLDATTIEHTTSLGGWGAHAPYAAARNKRVGMANPIKGLVDNSAARFVAPGSDQAEMLATYLQEHYYPNAKFKQVDTISNPKSSGELNVYQFYVS